MKVLNVRVEAFQGVAEVEFRPSPNGATLLAGKNEQGKSSTIQAIASTVQGKDELPADPIKHGAKRSKTTLDLGDDFLEFRVEQELSLAADGSVNRKLTVRDAEGVPQKKPQELLSSFFSKVAFDPLAFARAEPKEQDRVLKDLCGVTAAFAALDQKRQALYDQRHGINKQADQLAARAAGMPYHPKAPIAEVSVAELSKRITTAQEHAHARRSAEAAIERQQAEVARCAQEVESLKAQLLAAETKWMGANNTLNALTNDLAALAPNVDTTELQAQLETAEATNKLVRENAARREEERRAEKLRAESQELTDQMVDIETEKQRLLAEAKFPVEGLGFNDLGPTLHGVPLAQVSTARKLDLSYAVAVALNPKLKLLIIREGAFFDEDSLAAIDERAQRDGFQLLIERVGKRDKGSNVVIIENGLVESQATAAE